MNIGEAAKLSGLTVKTVRYYADIGLINPVKNIQNGYREYNYDHIAKLGFIGKARRFNFSIKECKELLSLYQDKNRSSKEVKNLTLQKIYEINKKIQELKSLRIQLNHLAQNCHGDDRPDCPIIDELSR